MQTLGPYSKYLFHTYCVSDTILSIRCNGEPDRQGVLKGACRLLGKTDYLNSYNRKDYGRTWGLEVDSL